MATTEGREDVKIGDPDSSSFLDDPLGTETPEARSMVPGEFQNPPGDIDADPYLGMGE